MPPQTNADVLRRHGIVKPACCLCRLCEARRYVTQPAYWASVLCEPEIPDFAEWDMDHAREFQNEPELPFGDVPAVFPFVQAVFGEIPAVLCVHKHKTSPPPTCTQARPHGPFCLLLVPRPG